MRECHERMSGTTAAVAPTRASCRQAMRIALIVFISITPIRGLSIKQNPMPTLELFYATANSSDRLEHAIEGSPINPTERPQTAHELVRADHRRPIWAIAHMVNSIKELDYRLSKGANAVEVDVSFSSFGEPLYTYHGPPCDCWRHCHQHEDFHDFLSYVRQIAIEQPAGVGQNLSLLFLDLKLDPLSQAAKMLAGQELAKSIMSRLFAANATTGKQQPSQNFTLILSVNHANDIDLVNNFVHTLEINNSSGLLKHIGFDVGMNDDIQLIESMWRRFGGALNLWQGDGYTNCFSPFYNLERLSKALAKRDNPLGYPAKVYHWTIDLHDRMRESLLLGVDALMTNHPERVLTVLLEPEIAHDYRLASRQDNPFTKLTRRLAGRSSESARYQRSANPNSGGFLGNLVDILTSCFHYIREIPFLSLPTILVPSSSRSSQSKRDGGGMVASPALVRFHNQPEYKIENVSLLTAPGDGSKLSLSDSLDRSLVQQPDANGTGAAEVAYEGPKWYVSLISNLLLSAVKVILPVR